MVGDPVALAEGKVEALTGSPGLDPSGVPDGVSSDAILDAFLDYLNREGIDPYPHQEEAVLELYEGKNVILNTPTGSGKSLVAMALQFKGLCEGRCVYYTVPIKALANEKFLSLCRIFGPERVGMITGDATVNAAAPVICCTAEILANQALREGADAGVDDVIMDEFHYYADHGRGWAWQIPLLILRKTRFLLMSATLGETAFFEETLTKLTGKETSVVRSEERPVPLEFSYSDTTLEEKVAELVDQDRAPVYLVNFTQRACAQTAQHLLSTNYCTKEEKAAIAEALEGARFQSPYGKEVKKLLRHGLGIHHAGLLPKYRVLVEKLAQKGLLKVICGTDTLGVGVNVPIRTVLFTRLCKYDGQGTRILSVRDFKQICGRAGRRGFDERGYVVVQAPEHVIENRKLEAKAADNAKKRRKIVKRRPPEKGYVAWDEGTFQRLMGSPPEALESRFALVHHLILNVLGRETEDGCAVLRRLIDDCHEPEEGKAALKKQAFALFKGLVKAGVLSVIPPSERRGPRKVKVNVDLQEDFSLNHALGLYLLDAIGELARDSPTYLFHLISVIEAILEHPMVILQKQRDKQRDELMAAMKAEGIGFEERLARLEEVQWPKPDEDFLYDRFNRFASEHPWVGESSLRLKSIAREMLENYQSFEDYIGEYGLQRSEGVLLRHLSEVYKVLNQTVPPAAKTEEVREAERYLEEMVRGVDSSLLDEWESLRDPGSSVVTAGSSALAKRRRETGASPSPPPLSRNRPVFLRVIRQRLFDLIKALRDERWAVSLTLIEEADPEGENWTAERLQRVTEAYLAERGGFRLDPEARNRRHTYLDRDDPKLWKVEQVLVDPEDLNDWVLRADLDVKRTDEMGEPVLRLQGLHRL